MGPEEEGAHSMFAAGVPIVLPILDISASFGARNENETVRSRIAPASGWNVSKEVAAPFETAGKRNKTSLDASCTTAHPGSGLQSKLSTLSFAISYGGYICTVCGPVPARQVSREVAQQFVRETYILNALT